MSKKSPESTPETNSSMEKLAFWTLTSLFVLLSIVWLLAPISREEGFADTVRVPDVFKGMLTHGPSWWTPNYMMGQHLATMYIAGLSIGTLALGPTFLGPVIGAMASFKLITLLLQQRPSSR